MLTADYRYNTGGYLNSFSFLKQHKQQNLLWLLKGNEKKSIVCLTVYKNSFFGSLFSRRGLNYGPQIQRTTNVTSGDVTVP